MRKPLVDISNKDVVDSRLRKRSREVSFNEEHLPCYEYMDDVISSLRMNEKVHSVKSDYLFEKQTNISCSMRSVLVDWLIEVADEYRLHQETLHLSLNYLDRFLEIHEVDRSRLQLAGISCLLLASKLEEVYPPKVDHFVFISDYTYTREEVIKMETLVVDSLEFKLAIATKLPFMHILLHCCENTETVGALSSYLADLSLLNYSLTRHLPSTIAAACIYLARKSVELEGWNLDLENASGLTSRDIQDPARDLLIQWRKYLSPSCNLHAVRDKYATKQYELISKVFPPSSI